MFKVSGNINDVIKNFNLIPLSLYLQFGENNTWPSFVYSPSTIVYSIRYSRFYNHHCRFLASCVPVSIKFCIPAGVYHSLKTIPPQCVCTSLVEMKLKSQHMAPRCIVWVIIDRQIRMIPMSRCNEAIPKPTLHQGCFATLTRQALDTMLT